MKKTNFILCYSNIWNTLFLSVILIALAGRTFAQVTVGSPLIPPANKEYLNSNGTFATYGSMATINFPVLAFSTFAPPPIFPGTSTTYSYNATFNGLMHPNIGSSYNFSSPAIVTMQLTRTIGSPFFPPDPYVGNYNAEMLQMNVQGGLLPPGTMIRESPTLQSTGQTSIGNIGNGLYQIYSFFDIFTELSTDGGLTWIPATSGASHMVVSDPCVPPVITCPANQTVNASVNCNQIVNYVPSPITTGSPAPVVSYTFTGATTGSGSGNGSGSIFNKGTTTVTLTATNACGSASCSFDVVVLDVIAPLINCAPDVDVTINAVFGQWFCNSVVNFAAPTASDNCSIAQAFNYTGSLQTFTVPGGVTSMKIETWGAQGANNHFGPAVTGGLGAYMSGNVTVAPGDQLIILVGGQGGIGGVGNGGGGGTFVVKIDPASLYVINIAPYVGLKVTPLMIAGGGGAGSGSGNMGGLSGNGQPGVIASSGTTSNGLPNGAPFGQGGFAQNFFFSFPFPPVSGAAGGGGGFLGDGQLAAGISGLSFLNGGTGGGQGGYGGGGGTSIYNYGGGGGGGYTGGDGGLVGAGGGGSYNSGANQNNLTGVRSGNGSVFISANLPVITQTTGLPSGSTFPVGTTTNTYVATDASGNTASCVQTIRVIENVLPTVICPANITVNADAGQCNTSVVTSNATTNDNCGVTKLSWAMNGATIGASSTTGINQVGTAIFNKGVTTISYIAEDASGNTATCSSTITVIDNQPPVITCPANITVTANYAGCTYSGSIGTATGIDNCIAPTITGPVPAGPYGTGATVVTWTATDAAGNTASCTQLVTVNNPIVATISGALAINCAGSGTVLDLGPGYNSYLWSNGATTRTIPVNTAGSWAGTVTLFGCTGTTSVNTTLYANLNTTISGGLTFCAGESTILDLGPGYNSYLWSTGATTQTISVNTAGTFAGTVSLNGCTGTASVNTTVTPNPAPTITGVLNFCAGSSTTLDLGAGFNSYLWSTGATTRTITVNTAGSWAGTVTLNGCTGTTSINTTIIANPVPTITGKLTFCTGSSTTLDLGAGYSSYLWSTGATTQTISVSTASTISGTITLNGCSGTTSVTITQIPNITASISGTLSFCAGGSTTLDLGPGYDNYLWSNGATTQTITVNTASSWIGTVTWNGCTASASVATTTFPTIPTTISGALVFCSGSSTILDLGAGNSTYLWSNGATTQTISVNTAATWTGTITLNGCTGSTSVNTTVKPNPTATIAGVSSFCPGSATTLDLGAGFNSYLWSTGATTQTITVNTAGTWLGTVSLNGCTSTTSVNTTFLTNIPATISGGLTFCNGSSTTLDLGAGYSSYLWSNGATTQTITVNTAATWVGTISLNGCTGTTSVNTTVTQNLTAIISGTLAFCSGTATTLDLGAGFDSYLWSTGATTQTITVNTVGTFAGTVTLNGCSGTTSVNTTFAPDPVATISGVLSFCSNGSTILDLGPGYDSYLWSTGATTQTITVSTASTWTGTIALNGCHGSTSVSTSIIPNPVATISGALSFCSGGSTMLDLGPGYSSYLWSTGATTQTITVSTAGSWSGTISLNGCTGSNTVNTSAIPNPVATITGGLTFCAAGSTTLDLGAGYSSYLWSTGATTQTITVNTFGTIVGTVSLNGCSGSTQVTTTMAPDIIATISGDLSICGGTSTILDLGPGFSTYLWSNGATTRTITVNTASTWAGTVTLNGCTSTASVTTTIHPNLTATISGNLSFCAGNSTTLDLGPGYTSYLWSNGATTQTITVSSALTWSGAINLNGCTGSTSVTTTVKPNPFATITGGLTFCAGDSTILDLGPGFNSYNWSTGATTRTITVNTAATWSGTVTLNGCSGSTSVNTNIIPNPVVAISGALTFCPGSSTTLNLGAGYSSYLWSNGATTQTVSATTASTWIGTVTLNGCAGTTSVSTSFKPLPTASCSHTNVSCVGSTNGTASVVAGAGNGIFAYQWTGAGSQTTATATGLIAGAYTITVTSDGCSATCSTIVGTVPDVTPPIITCPGAATVTANTSLCRYTGSIGTATATDNCSIPTITGPVPAGPYSLGTTVVTWTATDASGNTATCAQSVTVVSSSTATITPLGPTTFCQGGSVQLQNTPSGAGYLWSNGATTDPITVTSSGNYTVIHTDANGCTATAGPVTVTVKPLPTASCSHTDVSCPGSADGTVSVIAGAGNGSYSYQWTGTGSQTTATATGLTIGAYTVTVTSDGCTANCTTSIANGDVTPPTISCPANITSCTSNVTYTTTGTDNCGTPAISFIPPSGSNLPVGVNIVTAKATDATGNTATCTFTVTVPASMIINATKTNVRCGNVCNGSINIVVTGGSGPFTYAWDGGATGASLSNLCAGNYTCTVTDANGCTKSKTIAIIGNATLTATVFPTSTTLAATAGGGVAPYTYLWNTSPAQTNATATGLSPSTNYKVKVTDSKNCTKLVQASTLSSKLSSANTNEASVSVYPNPTTGVVTLTVSNCINCNVLVNMFDAIGQQVYSKEMKVENNTTLDFSALATGIYTMRVMYDGRIEVVKIVVQ